MDEMRVTGIGRVVTEPASSSGTGNILIEILTSEGQESLVMSATVAKELAAAIVKHLRQEQSVSGTE